MANDDSAKTEEIMAALSAQHWSIDVLMAHLINLTAQTDDPFLPSKSIVWPQLTSANRIWEKLRFQHQDIVALGFCEESLPGFGNMLVPCGKVASNLMRCSRDKRDYFMCDACSDHNEKRGMVKLRKVNGH